MPERTPKYGDPVFVPDGYGTWVMGICNTVDPDTEELLIGVPAGAHKSGAVAVTARRSRHLTEWAWPHDMPSTHRSN